MRCECRKLFWREKIAAPASGNHIETDDEHRIENLADCQVRAVVKSCELAYCCRHHEVVVGFEPSDPEAVNLSITGSVVSISSLKA
jgi:hypothetical protein